MLAFHIGVEVGNKIGDAMSPRHQQDGYHTIGTTGTLGSVAACAKLRGLDADKTCNRHCHRRVRSQRPSRQFRLHDQAVPRRACRRERHRSRRSRGHRLDRRAGYSRSAAGIFCSLWRIRSQSDCRPPWQTVDVCVPGRFDQAMSLRHHSAAGDGRYAAASSSRTISRRRMSTELKSAEI